MTKGMKIAGIGLFIVIGIIVGFIFLIRSCIDMHDKYSQFDEAQLFKNSNSDIIVFLKDHFNVTSYSSQGGMTRVSGYSKYYLETRDVKTLKLLKSTPFEKIDDPVKQRPKIIGRDEKNLWIFIGSIKAYDPFTHQLVCTKEKLEELNPGLKNNLPEDATYYKYNYIADGLEITTKNALKFRVSGTFKAQKIIDDQDNETPEIAALKEMQKKLENERTDNAQKNKPFNSKEYWKLGDSIREIQDLIRKKTDEIKERKDYNKNIDDARTKGFNYSNERLGNAAVVDSTIYALLSDKELKDNSQTFHFRKIFNDEVQRQLYATAYNEMNLSNGFNSYCKISDWKLISNNSTFLKGGFLEDKSNLIPIELNNPLSWIIVTAKEVGNQSPLILQRVNANGISMWTKELPLKEFSDMLFTGERLILFSNDGGKISGSDNCNWLYSIDLMNGEIVFLDLGMEN